MSSWLLLVLAIVFEIGGTTAMKLSEGFSKPIPSVMVVVCYVICFGALTLALREIDLSVAYAVWAGIGTALIAAVGIAVFGEPISALKVGSIAAIVLGVVGLNLSITH